MERHKCGLGIGFKHPPNLVAFVDVAVETPLGEFIGLAFKGSAALLCEDRKCDKVSNSTNGTATPIDFSVRRKTAGCQINVRCRIDRISRQY